MVKLLTIGWVVWKVAAKRFGPVLGFVIAIGAVTGYLTIRRWMKKEFSGSGVSQ